MEAPVKKQIHGWIWIGLGISLFLALFLSPFSSSSPDGLEKVAEMKGFKEKGETWRFWKHAPLPDYALRWIKNEKVSTAFSGLLGTLAIFLIALGIGKLLRRSPGKKGISLLLVLLSLSFYSSLIGADRSDLSMDRLLGMGWGSGDWNEQGCSGFSGDHRIDPSF